MRSARSFSITSLCALLVGCGNSPPVNPTAPTVQPNAVYEAAFQASQTTGRLELQFRQPARRLMATAAEVASLRVVLTGANALVQEFDGAMLAANASGAQGSVAFNALTPGQVTVTVEARRANGGTIGTANVTVDITAGQTTVAALSLDLEDTYMTNPNGALEADVTIRDGSTVVEAIAPAASRLGFPLVREAPTVLASGLNFVQTVDLMGDKLYVCDTYNRQIRVVDVNSGAMATVASGSFVAPWYLTVAGTKVYVSDDHKRIKVIDTANGNSVSTLLDNTNVSGLTVVGSKLYFGYLNERLGGIKSLDLTDGMTIETVVPEDRLNGPAGLASDGTAVYVAEFYGNSIRRFDTKDGYDPTVTNVISTLLRSPLNVDARDGKVYVADTYNGAIRWASTTPGSPVNTLLNGLFEPRGIAVGPDGRVYVGGGWNQNVLRLPAVQ